MIAAPSRRRGFTLLEVLLASAIAILLLAALYVAFDVTLRQSDAGREAVSRGDLTRALANRMGIDLACCIGPMPPKSGGGLPDDASASEVPTSTPEEELADPTAALDVTEGSSSADLPFQGGLFGSDKQLTLYVSRVPPALANPETSDKDQGGIIDLRPDLRRVTYYLGSSGGLCRQEKPWVTADGVRNSADPDRSEEASDLIAEEVVDITFSYYGTTSSGTAWNSSWTGSDTASDGGSVIGPPRAIKVTMVIQLPGSNETRTVSHVFPLRAAVGLYQPPPPPEPETTDPATAGTTP